MGLRPKEKCEICGLKKSTILHRHHIIPRVDERSTNYDYNLAILCPNCHSLVHSGEYIIIGVYHTSGGTKPIWFHKNGVAPFPKEFWNVKENPLVLTLRGEDDDLPDEK